MPNADKFDFEDRDESYVVQEASLGISGVSGITKRGEINDPSVLITSEIEFLRRFGGRMVGNDFPDICLRILRKGGILRVNRIAHYTDVTDATTLTALAPTTLTIQNSFSTPENLFTIASKYKGAEYNNLRVVFKAATNANALYFDMDVFILGDEVNTFETYTNLQYVPGVNPETDNVFFQKVNSQSKLIIVAPTGNTPANGNRPANATKVFTGGTNGGTVLPADYVGAQTGKTGFNAFDAFDDMMQVAVPAIYDAAVNNGGADYADGREDLMFFGHLNPSTLYSDLVTTRNAITVDTKYAAIFSGGIIFSNPVDQQPKAISEVGDVLRIANYVDANFGPWYSIAGKNRATVSDALGVVANFGGKGNYALLNILANNQINMMVADKGKIYQNGNFTLQRAESKASFINVVRLLIYIKKSLGPTIEKYLEEPLDIPTFIKLANEVEPFLQRIQDERGLYAFKWDGDQNVGNILDVKVNNLADIDLGKYKVNLILEPINGIGEITVGIILSKTGTVTMDIVSDTTSTF